MEFFNETIKYSPEQVLKFTEAFLTGNRSSNYQFDSLANREIVKFVETMLTDYQSLLQSSEKSLCSLLNMLDIFADAGWANSMKMIWRLDSIYR